MKKHEKLVLVAECRASRIPSNLNGSMEACRLKWQLVQPGYPAGVIQQKFSSVKQKIATNDRYAMRCFLLRLGFISEEFKTSRKILLSKLDGDAAFRKPEAKQTAEEKRKGKSG